MAWPRLVERPPAEPSGASSPLGSGFDSFTGKVRPLSLLGCMGVDWLKPARLAGGGVGADVAVENAISGADHGLSVH